MMRGLVALGAGEADETQTEWNIVLAKCGQPGSR